MGVSGNFSQFCFNLRMTNQTVEKIASRFKRITKQLNKDFWEINSDISNSLYVGSYGRDTDIHVSDIDVIFRLPYKKYKQYNSHSGNGQSALLQEVKQSIERTYNSYIRADGQVIKVDFTDGICFEVVPGFINKDNINYTYPDTNNGGSWKVTKPKEEINEINIKNNKWNKNLKKLCRMARAWKEKWNVPMGGLLIDTLAHDFMKDWKYKNESYIYYDWLTRDFFKFLNSQNEDQNYWFAPGSNQKVYRDGKFEYKALRCYNISLDAIENQKKNYEWSAKQKWREIYGEKFPN